MSETPGFVGQKYTDTATGNVWNANSTTPGDWSLQLQNMGWEWEPVSVDFSANIGFFTYSGIAGITKLTYNGTTNIPGLDIETMPDLTEFLLPNLVSIDPLNTAGGFLYCITCPVLTTLSAPQLTAVGDTVTIYDNPALVNLDLSALTSVGNALPLTNNTSLVSLDLHSLSAVTGYIDASGCTSLTTVNLAGLTALSGNCKFTNCALSTASVDHVLARLVSIATYGNSGEVVDLSGGTNSAPTSTGVGSDYATLVARGANVSVNP